MGNSNFWLHIQDFSPYQTGGEPFYNVTVRMCGEPVSTELFIPMKSES